MRYLARYSFYMLKLYRNKEKQLASPLKAASLLFYCNSNSNCFFIYTNVLGCTTFGQFRFWDLVLLLWYFGFGFVLISLILISLLLHYVPYTSVYICRRYKGYTNVYATYAYCLIKTCK